MEDADAVFGIAACGHQLLALAHHPTLPASQHAHPWDLLLLLNFVAANPSYSTDLAGQQAWVPFCLPKSAPHCFHFLYLHFPEQGSPLFVALVGRRQEQFFQVRFLLSLTTEGYDHKIAFESHERIRSQNSA